jgi:hypothetical protein
MPIEKFYITHFWFGGIASLRPQGRMVTIIYTGTSETVVGYKSGNKFGVVWGEQARTSAKRPEHSIEWICAL